ncbi:hypothetical protein HYH02_006623 [Chlamydomonas schloesseri]|uniref:Protein kinase domain-containing protein n=1 Tax=Chlamydomonas schloesseri TaxID=2026947 RepID=A0A835TIP1_9CHLO|nr:hypothetical protein HYH02_006623 [Chlamydomonas schloesseri]|eukprot:KAG2439101.1 hypothetical protein HYH02_006623 [Chlamydomonas schloesseri]
MFVIYCEASGLGLTAVDLRSLSGLFSVPANGTLELRGLNITGAALPSAPYPLPASGFLALSAFRLGAGARLRLVDSVLTVPSCALLSLHQTYACGLSPSPNVTMAPSSLVVHRLTTPSLDAWNVTVQCSGAAAPFPCLAASVDSGTELVQAVFDAERPVATRFALFGSTDISVYLFLSQHIELAEAAALHDVLCRASRASSSGATPADANANVTGSASAASGPAAAAGAAPPPLAAPAPTGPTVWAGCVAPLNFRLVLSGGPGAATVLDLAGTTSWLRPGERGGGLELRRLTLRRPPAGPAEAVPLGLMRLLTWTADFSRRNIGRRSQAYLSVSDCAVELPAAEVAMWRAQWGLPLSPRLQAALCLKNDEMVLADVVADQAPGFEDGVVLVSAVGRADASLFANVTLLVAAAVAEAAMQVVAGSEMASALGVLSSTAAAGVVASTTGSTTSTSRSSTASASYPDLCIIVPHGAQLPMSSRAYRRESQRLLTGADLLALTAGVDNSTSEAERVPLEQTPFGELVASYSRGVSMQLSVGPRGAAGKLRVYSPVMLMGDFYDVVELDLDGRVAVLSITADPVPALVTLRRLVLTGLPRAASCCVDGAGVANASVLVSPGTAANAAATGNTQGLAPALANFTSCLWTFEFDRSPQALAADTAGGAGGRPAGLPRLFLDSVVLVVPEEELQLLGRVWAASADLLSGRLSFSVDTDPGLAAALMLMLQGSALAGSSGGRNAIPALRFARLQWCGYVGSDVTLTSPGYSDTAAAALQRAAAAWGPSPAAGLPPVRMAGPEPQAPPQTAMAATPAVLQLPPAPQDALAAEADHSGSGSVGTLNTSVPASAGDGLDASSGQGGTKGSITVAVPVVAALVGAALLVAASAAMLWAWRRSRRRQQQPPGPKEQGQPLDRISTSRGSRFTPRSTASGFTGTETAAAAAAFVDAGSSADDLAVKSSRTASVAISADGRVRGGNARQSWSRLQSRTWALIAGRSSRSRRSPQESQRRSPASTGSGLVSEVIQRISRAVAMRAASRSSSSGMGSGAIGASNGGADGSGGGDTRGVEAANGDAALSASGGAWAAPQQQQQRASLPVPNAHLESAVRKAVVDMLADLEQKRVAPEGEGEGAAVDGSAGGACIADGAASALAPAACADGRSSGPTAWKLPAAAETAGTQAPRQPVDVAALGMLRPRSQTADGCMRPVSQSAPQRPTAIASGLEPGVWEAPPPLLSITGELGRGAQGVVYRGVWRGLDVAVKSVLFHREPGPGDRAARAIAMQRAVQEAAIAVSMAHPNIVATYTYQLQPLHTPRESGRWVHAAGETFQTPPEGPCPVSAPLERTAAEAEVWKLTLVQELCDANSLRHCLQSGRLARGPQAGADVGAGSGAEYSTDGQATALQPVPARTVLLLACDIARGLAHLHERGVVHADLSSNNVLLQSNRNGSGTASSVLPSDTDVGFMAKLCDFGLSGRLDVEADATHLSGPTRRSSAYSAPELVAHGRSGHAGDVYAFAVVLWELALGLPLPAALARPESASLRAWLSEQARLAPVGAGVGEGPGAGTEGRDLDLSSLALPSELLWWPAGTPPALVSLVAECLRPEPRSRPPAAAVLQRLQRLWKATAVP